MLEEIKNIKSEKSDLRNFGIIVGIILLIISGFLFWKEKESFQIFLANVLNQTCADALTCSTLLSSIITPSLRFTIRLVMCAISSSCVTTRIVLPSSFIP